MSIGKISHKPHLSRTLKMALFVLSIFCMNLTKPSYAFKNTFLKPRKFQFPSMHNNFEYNNIMQRRWKKTTTMQRYAEKQQTLSESKKAKPKGVYTRPSAAIERGSGFYVPGLEGSRVRGLFGLLVLILTFVNHTYSSTSGTTTSLDISSSMMISEIVSISYSVLLILQGLVEFGKEQGFVVNTSNDIDSLASTLDMDNENQMKSQLNENKKNVKQYASPQLLSVSSSQLINDLQWSCASFLSLTSATHILLVKVSNLTENNKEGEDSVGLPSILYTLGPFESNSDEDLDENMATAVRSVIRTAFNSKGGRVSIPSDHSGSCLIPDEDYRRCLLLQRLNVHHNGCNDQYCLMVGSNQLLAAFTKNDLKWLGQLAKYLELSLSTP